MLAPAEHAPNSQPSPLPSSLLAAELGPAVMADDPCEAAFSVADPTGPRNYYRARYYDPKAARFLSEDPIRFAGGINFYSYVSGNPVNQVDPDGEDAIYIGYRWFPVDTGFGFKAPFGHAAVIAVNPKTGTTKYFEYGRYGGDFGAVMGPGDRPVPDLVMGKDGTPTEESLKALYDFISMRYGKGSTVDAEYYADADFQKVVDFAYRRMRDKKRQSYSWNPFNPNHCKSFAREAIEAGRQ